MHTIQMPNPNSDEDNKNALPRVHAQLARTHAALHVVRQGMQRWTSEHSPLQLAGSDMPPSQLAWHAKANNDLITWLAEGGFASGDNGTSVMDSNTSQADARPK